MKPLKAITAALAAAALATAVALPASANEGTGSGGVSPSDPQSQDAQQARAATYEPVRATWYGPGFFGHRTACGTVLTHATLGVAHKRLPCGTKVALRYHGRTVVVPVIDRGPYSRGVDFDLTYATARKLGMAQTSRVGAAELSN